MSRKKNVANVGKVQSEAIIVFGAARRRGCTGSSKYRVVCAPRNCEMLYGTNLGDKQSAATHEKFV